MGRMHVILRRQTGKVTDLEYMRIDPGYCRYLLNLAAQHKHEDMQQICAKLEELYFGKDGIFMKVPPKAPLLERRGAVPPDAVVALPVLLAEKPANMRPANNDAQIERTYIGRLR